MENRGGKSQRREEQRRERVRRKKMQVREKGRKAAKHCVSQEGQKVDWLAATEAGAEPSVEIRDETLQNPSVNHF